MSARPAVVIAVCLAGLPGAVHGDYQPEPVQVEATDLENRRDLVGREVVVDDHVAYYVPRSGSEPDELQLKRTTVTFLIPRRLRPPTTSRFNSAQLRGTLKREGARLVCEVTALKALPGDLERLEQGITSLSPRDYESRQSWARWAQRRGRDFKDNALLKRALQVETDALRIEADFRRQTVDAPQEWLAMARDARKRGLEEPEPSAQAHRALRARLATVSDVAAVKATLQEIDFFFPDAATDRLSARVDLTKWQAPYLNDPAGTYRSAPPAIRRALDRRLWADATERLMTAEPTPDLESAVALSERAENVLPEKPDLSGRLMENAVALARQNLGAARLAEVKELARIYKEKLRRPDDAQTILREWLKIQTERLSKTDAEGPMSLAVLYEELVSDRVTAVELLRKAWRIDPSSKEIAEAFRSRGFHKDKDDWVQSVVGTDVSGASGSAVPGQPPVGASSKGLKGLTPDEVRARIGSRPDRVNYVGSRSQLIEQWIYVLDSKLLRYINFLRTPGDQKPRVIADYQLPGIMIKGGNRSTP